MPIGKLRAVWLLLFCLLGSPLLLAAAESPGRTVSVGDGGATLYPRQDVHSAPIAKLIKDEPLYLIAEAVGTESWYMVRTNTGLTGWVRAAEVVARSQVREIFQDKESGNSTWAAITADGRAFRGTWSANPGSTGRSASGGWALRDSSGAVKLRGSWSAEMHKTGWNGTWRASMEGGKTEYRGSWSVEMENPQKASFAELFEAAARDATRGIWTAGHQSGSWSIRAVK